MDEQSNKAYLTGVFDQLETAVARHNRVAAHQVVDRVEADGYPVVADILRRGLADTSLGADDPAGGGE